MSDPDMTIFNAIADLLLDGNITAAIAQAERAALSFESWNYHDLARICEDLVAHLEARLFPRIIRS